MSKKTIYFLLLILALIAGIYMYAQNNGSEPILTLPETEAPSSDPMEKTDNRNVETIMAIYSNAQNGMIPDIPFMAGESVRDEVLSHYGEPVSSDDTDSGRYETYPEESLTVGYRGSAVSDLKSERALYQKITRQEIIEELGEPDETAYFRESGYDQTILIYSVGIYKLKWILDNSMNPENPYIDHISVVSESVESEESPSAEIEETLAQMTLDEKIGQMIFAGIFGTEPEAASLELITEHHVGGIIFNSQNLTGPSQTVRYVNALKNANGINPVPLFFGIDQEGGRVSKLPGGLLPLPSALEVGERNSETYSYEVGRILAELVRAYGFNTNFAPVMDVNSNPENPVIGDRSFGNDPDLVTKHGIQVMKGLQSENIIPTVKHFPGHGDTSVDSHLALPTVPKTMEELLDLELIPFQKAIQEGADMVMIAHLLFPKLDPTLPSSLSRLIISGLLRESMGYEGVIITDDLAMNAITDNFSIGDAAVMSVNAGSDIIMVANIHDHMLSAVSGLKEAVENGSITEERIDESVMRILKLKDKYAVSDAQTVDADLEDLNALIRSLEDKE